MTAEERPPSEVLRSLQILRAVAALLVVYNHAQGLAWRPENLAWQAIHLNLSRIGAIGVDIFFVISGVVITITASRVKTIDEALVFGVKRFLRVVPFYWVISGLFAVWMLSRGTAGNDLDPNRLVATFLFYPDGSVPIIYVGWTLCFELLFYLYTFVYLLCRFSNNVSRLLIGVVAYLICMLFLPERGAANFFLNPIIAEFALGVWLGKSFISGYRLPVRAAKMTLIVGCGMIAAQMLAGFGPINDAGAVLTAQVSAQRVMLWGMPSSLIVLGALNLEAKIPPSTTARFFVALGDASYSIYLVHLLVFWSLERWNGLRVFSPDVLIPGAVMAATAVGILVHWFVERPIIRVSRVLVGAVAQLISADKGGLKLDEPRRVRV